MRTDIEYIKPLTRRRKTRVRFQTEDLEINKSKEPQGCTRLLWKSSLTPPPSNHCGPVGVRTHGLWGLPHDYLLLLELTNLMCAVNTDRLLRLKLPFGRERSKAELPF